MPELRILGPIPLCRDSSRVTASIILWKSFSKNLWIATGTSALQTVIRLQINVLIHKINKTRKTLTKSKKKWDTTPLRNHNKLTNALFCGLAFCFIIHFCHKSVQPPLLWHKQICEEEEEERENKQERERERQLKPQMNQTNNKLGLGHKHWLTYLLCALLTRREKYSPCVEELVQLAWQFVENIINPAVLFFCPGLFFQFF